MKVYFEASSILASYNLDLPKALSSEAGVYVDIGHPLLYAIYLYERLHGRYGIIVDGGSKDGTLNIINKFIQENKRRFSDVKLVIHDRNYGVSKARNDGIKASRGKYLLILDHDVVMPSSTIGALFQYLESMDGRVVAAIPLHNNLCGGILSKWEYRIRKGRVSRINAITSCALIRRELIDQIGLYDETLGPPYTVYEDIEFGARALAKGVTRYTC